MTVPISRGFTTSAVLDDEASYNTPRTSTAIKGILTPYIPPFGVVRSRSMNQSNVIRGTAMPSKPFIGNASVKGSMSWEFISRAIGKIFKYGFGTVSTVEFPQPSGSSGSDIGAGGTLTVASGDGSYTFGSAQTAIVGDRVIYSKSGTIYTGYITTKTNSTTGNLSTDILAGTPAPNISGATVLYIAQNQANSTPGTVTISSGTATFSQTHSSLAAGQMLIYDQAPAKYARVTAKLTATTATVVDAFGHAPADASGKTVEWLGILSYFTHTFAVPAIAQLPTFVLQKSFPDLTSPVYETYTGCKISKIDFAFGGDAELFVNTDIMGVFSVPTQYDASPYAIGGTKLYQLQTSATLNASPADVMESMTLSLDNQITPHFVIGGLGKAGATPEGIRQVSGKFTALYGDDTTVRAVADGVTPNALVVTVDSGVVDKFVLTIPEIVFEPMTTPVVNTGAGVTQELNIVGFNADPAGIVMTVALTNQAMGY